MDITELYKNQVDLSAWFEAMGYPDIQKFRKEDNDKRERLAVLHEMIGLPFDKQTRFDALDIEIKSPEFVTFLKENSKNLCALRLVPKDPSLPKLRMRGKTVEDVLDWYHEQPIDPHHYWADFVPHSDTTRWSTIFVINDKGIFGEIIAGGHHQLTQGFYENQPPHVFSFDFATLQIEREGPEVREHLEKIFRWLRVESDASRKKMAERLQATFVGPYLKGYFETVFSDTYGLWFIDYNRVLGDLHDLSSKVYQVLKETGEPLICGTVAGPGKIKGKAHILSEHTTSVRPDEIIVCEMTTPCHLPFMKQAAGIITERGGMLSHAAIVSRELEKPCVVGAEQATTLLKNGDQIFLDATTGQIFKI